jgi:hypothetical protein
MLVHRISLWVLNSHFKRMLVSDRVVATPWGAVSLLGGN